MHNVSYSDLSLIEVLDHGDSRFTRTLVLAVRTGSMQRSNHVPCLKRHCIIPHIQLIGNDNNYNDVIVRLQITYHTQAAESGFRIIGESDNHDPRTLVDCVTERRHVTGNSVTAADPMVNTCHAAAVVHLDRRQRVWIENEGGYYRPMVMSRWSTFWGINRLT